MRRALGLLMLLLFTKTLFSQADCPDGHILLNKSTITIPGLGGFGTFEQLAGVTCLAGNEHESYWFKFKCTASGSFEFMCTPDGLGADYDFAVMKQCPCTGNPMPISCSYVGPIVPPGPFVPTGVSANPLAVFGTPPQAEIIPTSLNLVAGETYYIVLDNITTNGVGFTIQFSGTAGIGPTMPNMVLTSSITGPTPICKSETGNIYKVIVPPGLGMDLTFDWTITPGTASIDGGGPIAQTTVNSISVDFFNTGNYNIKCVITDPCTGTIVNANKTVVVLPELPDKDSTFVICAEDPYYTYNGVNYEPGVTSLDRRTPAGCYKLNIIVNQLPEIYKDLGDVPLCRTESFKVCGKTFTIADEGIQTGIICPGTGNIAPKSCDTSLIFNIVPMVITPKLNFTDSTFNCPGDSMLISACATTYVPGVSTTISFQWRKDGIVIPGAKGCTLVAKQPGTYIVDISLTYNWNDPAGKPKSKTCTESVTIRVRPSSILPPVAPLIQSPLKMCSDSFYTFTVTNAALNGFYTWIYEKDTIIGFSGPTALIKVKAPGGNVCVYFIDNCKQKSIDTCVSILVNQRPSDPVIIGDTIVCGNVLANYCIANPVSGETYEWILPTGATFTSPSANCIAVNWGSIIGATTLCLKATNECGTVTTCINVFIAGIPNIPDPISGSITGCVNDTVTYQVAFVPGVAQYSWNLTGGSIVGSAVSNAIKVVWNSTGNQTICVKATNNCGTSADRCLAVMISEKSPAAVIVGNLNACEKSTQVYAIPALKSNESVIWTVTGGTIINGQNTNQIDIRWDLVGTGKVCCDLINECGPSTTCINVNVIELPKSKAGGDKKLCGLSGGLDALSGIGTGLWSLISGPTSGIANFNNPVNPQTNLSVNLCGLYTFQWTENNLGCKDSTTQKITFTDNPKAATILEQCTAAQTQYAVSFNVNGCANSYTITDLLGNILGTTSTTPFSFTSPLIAESTPYSFIITDSEGCVSSAIAGIKNCNCPTKAGTMSSQLLEICDGLTGQAIHNAGSENLEADDTFEYILHTNNGTQLGTILDRNQTGIFGFLPTMLYETTYYISYVAGNKVGTQVDLTDPCRSVAPGQPILFHRIPKPFAGADAEFCGNSTTLFAQPDLGAGSWLLLPGSAGTVNFLDSKFPNTTVNVTPFGKYFLEWSDNNKGCIGKDTVIITFNADDLSVSTPNYVCDVSGQFYTATISISNGNAPYVVNGVALAGNSFTTNSIATSSTDSIVVVDGKGCKTVTVPLFKVCDCKTDVNSFVITSALLCETDTLSAVGTSTLDPTDDFEYLITDNCDLKSSTTTILDRNKTGKFILSNSLQCGQSYQVVYVAGNKNPTTGNVDLADPCLDFDCKSFVFNCTPKVDAGIGNNLCNLNSLVAGSNTVGALQWTKLSGIGNVAFGNDKNANTTVAVSACGKYTFQLSGNNKGCVSKDTVQFEFSEKPVLSNLVSVCDPTFVNYSVALDVKSCATNLLINGMNGGALNNGKFASNPIDANTANFKFVFSDPLGCKDSISGSKICDCQTSSGSMANTLLKECVPSSGVASITSNSNGDYVLDGNDTYEYILTDNVTGNPLGTILDRNKTGIFNYSAALQFGKTYYIVFIVGDSLANGQVSFTSNAKCLSLVSRPIQFFQCPEVTCGGDQIIDCQLSATLSSTAVTSTGLWKVVSKPINSTVNFGSTTNASTTVTVDVPGTYRIRRVEQNDIFYDSCETILTFNVTPAPKLVANTTVFTTNCTDTTYTVSMQLSGLPPYQLLAGSAAATFSGNILTSAPIKSESNYQFIIKDSKSCDSLVISGTFKTKCKSNAGSALADVKVCAPLDSAIFLPNILVGEEPNGIWVSDPPVSGLFDIFFTRNALPGVYKISYIIPGKNTPPSFEGDTSSFTITLNPRPTADAGADQVITCSVLSVPLGGTNTSQSSTTNLTWTGGTVGNAAKAVTTTSKSGIYVLQARDIISGCADSDTVVVVTKNEKPSGAALSTGTSCPGNGDGSFSIFLNNGTKPYQFSYQQTGYNKVPDDKLTFSALKPGEYTLRIKDANDCTWDTLIIIQEPKAIAVTLGPDINLILGDSTKITATILNYSFPNDIDTIIWKFREQDTLLNTTSFTIAPTTSGRYCIYVKNKNGCEATACVWVGVETKYPVFIPNVFSPNDDQYNDLFVPYGDPRFVKEVESFAVYDRWGNQMYFAQKFLPGDESFGWDGNFNGKKMNPGLYVFHAKITFIDGTTRVFKGDVTIVER